MILFHGTTNNRLDSILLEGIIPANYHKLARNWLSDDDIDLDLDDTDLPQHVKDVRNALKKSRHLNGKVALSVEFLVAESFAFDGMRNGGYGLYEYDIVNPLALAGFEIPVPEKEILPIMLECFVPEMDTAEGMTVELEYIPSDKILSVHYLSIGGNK